MTTADKGGRRRRLGWSTTSFSLRLSESKSAASSRKSISSAASASTASFDTTSTSAGGHRTRHQELLEALKDIGETSDAASVLAEHKLATLSRLETVAGPASKRHTRATSIFGRRRSESAAPPSSSTSSAAQKATAAHDSSRRHGRIEPTMMSSPPQRHLCPSPFSPKPPCGELERELAEKQRANAKILEELSDLVCLATAQRYNREQLEQQRRAAVSHREASAEESRSSEEVIVPANLSNRSRMPPSPPCGGLSPGLETICTSPLSSSLHLPHTLDLVRVEGLEPVPLAPLPPRRVTGAKGRARSKSHGPGSRPAAVIEAASTVPTMPKPALRRAPSDISQETPRPSQASKLHSPPPREYPRRPVPPLPASSHGAILAAAAASASAQRRLRPGCHGGMQFEDACEVVGRSPGGVSSATTEWYSAVSRPTNTAAGTRQRSLSHASSTGSTLFDRASASSIRSRDSASTLTSRDSFLSLASQDSADDRLRPASRKSDEPGPKAPGRSCIPTPTFGVIAEGQLPVFSRRRTLSEASVEALAAYDPRVSQAHPQAAPQSLEAESEVLQDDDGRFDDAVSPFPFRRPPSSGSGCCYGTTGKPPSAFSSQLASLGCPTRGVGLGLMV